MDFDASQGLLSLGVEARHERDTQYEALVRDWQRLRDSRFFDTLRRLINGELYSGAVGLGASVPDGAIVRRLST